LSQLYQIPKNYLFFGKKAEFIQTIRQRAAKG